MTPFVVHTFPGSPFARAVMATLEEKRAAWRIAPLAAGAARQEPHLSRHPFGRMPVLEHGDFVLYETQAILRYVDRVAAGPSLVPDDPRAAARMDQVMGINDWYLFPGCANVIVFQRIIGPAVLGITPDEALVAEALPRARTVLKELARLLGRCKWIAGDAFSLADLLLAPQLAFFAQTPEWSGLTADAANLVAWLARVEARPSLQATNWDRVRELARAA